METGRAIQRALSPRVREALSDTPVVLVAGPRQAGKTTLVRGLCAEQGRTYLTLDDPDLLLAARQDPKGLLAAEWLAIDEIQRAPGLLPAIKQSVDQDRRPGRFLLTGSADLMTLPTVTESLAGRMETLPLLPFAQCELAGDSGNTLHWLDAVFAQRMPQPVAPQGAAWVPGHWQERVLVGGYPEMLARASARGRQRWVAQYVDALIQRDVRDIAAIEKIDVLPRLLNAIAQVSGQLCNYTALGGQLGIDKKTTAAYLAVFEQMFLLQRVQPWYGNALARLVKTPKIQFLDSGLLAALRGINETTLRADRTAYGALLECFVYAELLKISAWSDERYRFTFFRDKDGHEVDIVVEDSAGRVVGVEVKAARSVQAADFRGLRKLAALAGEHFLAGIVLYDGEYTLSVGEGMWAMPLSTLEKFSPVHA